MESRTFSYFVLCSAVWLAAVEAVYLTPNYRLTHFLAETPSTSLLIHCSSSVGKQTADQVLNAADNKSAVVCGGHWSTPLPARVSIVSEGGFAGPARPAIQGRWWRGLRGDATVATSTTSQLLQMHPHTASPCAWPFLAVYHMWCKNMILYNGLWCYNDNVMVRQQHYDDLIKPKVSKGLIEPISQGWQEDVFERLFIKVSQRFDNKVFKYKHKYKK